MNDVRGSRLLITGSAGFVGRALASAAHAAGASVFGVDMKITPTDAATLAGAFVGDLCDAAFAREVLRKARPSHIVHLAGVLPGAGVDSSTHYHVNTIATTALFDAILAAAVEPVVLVNSSSAVYGPGRTDGRRITEADDLAPVSHYGISKAAQELVARMYHATHGVRAMVARTFNLVGPGQSATLVASDVARQIAMAERSATPPVVRVGDLAPIRDFLDVRDAAAAYLQLLPLGRPGGTYNVCSGVGRTVADCVNALVGLARVPIEIRQDAGRISKADVQAQVGDPSRLHELTGWEPRIPLCDSLRDLLEYWRGAR